MIGYRRRGAHYRPATAAAAAEERHVRTPGSLPVFAALACIALVGVTLASPHVPSEAEVLTSASTPVGSELGGQRLAISGSVLDAVTRDGVNVTKIPTAKPQPRLAPTVGIPDPGTAQAIAYDMVIARGWDSTQFDCLVSLWDRESHWNVYSSNANSGAYGIPQALPGSKMASAGADWATNPATQITWGLGYITGRYGTPCAAWDHSNTSHWY